MDFVILILNVVGLLFLVRWGKQVFKDFKNAPDKKKFFTFRRFRNSGTLALIIIIPVVFVNFLFKDYFTNLALPVLNTDVGIRWMSTGVAFLISFIWIMYLRKLDIFEPEKWIYLIITFVLSCFLADLFVIDLYRFVDHLGFQLSEDRAPVQDFLYCFLVIGGIEELFKIIPVIVILLFFRKGINEPFDYILYGSVAALGFAFMENIEYIYRSDLHNIGSRALYASVMHMCSTSTACYGLMGSKFKLTKKSKFLIIPFYFLLAMAFHGFYDFWLISTWGRQFAMVTTLFFLLTIHLWFIMKNNTINISNFYKPYISMNNDQLRYFLIKNLSQLLMAAYIIIALQGGRAHANHFLRHEILAFGYLVFYLAFSLSRYRLEHNKLSKLKIPVDFYLLKPQKVNCKEFMGGSNEK